MAQNRYVHIVRPETAEILLAQVRWCESRLCRLRGLQFRRRLPEGDGLVLVGGSDSIGRSSIHMFFVLFPIAAVWINSAGLVTHATLARPWRPYYASPEPARYVLETTPAFLTRIQVGDRVEFRINEPATPGTSP